MKDQLDRTKDYDVILFNNPIDRVYASIVPGLPTEQTHCAMVKYSVRGPPAYRLEPPLRRKVQRSKRTYEICDVLRVPGHDPYDVQCAAISKWLHGDDPDLEIRTIVDAGIIGSLAASVWRNKLKPARVFNETQNDPIKI